MARCKSCKQAPAQSRATSVVQLCAQCIADKAQRFYAREGESFAQLRARQRAEYLHLRATFAHGRR